MSKAALLPTWWVDLGGSLGRTADPMSMADVQGFPGHLRGRPFATVEQMNGRFRDYLAATIGIVALTLGSFALVLGRVDFGLTFRADGDTVSIDNVSEHSPARMQGFEPGMIVLGLNGIQLMRLPTKVCPEAGCDATTPETTPTIEPATPTPVHLDATTLTRLLSSDVTDLTAIRPADLASFNVDQSPGITYSGRNYVEDLRGTTFGLFAGAILLIVGAWWLATGRGGSSLQPIAIPLALATSLPFLLRPLEATWFGTAVVAAGIILPFGVATLGLALADRVEEPEIRGVARMAAVGFATGAMLIGAGRLALIPGNDSVGLIWGAMVAATVLIPGLAAAGPLRSAVPATGASGGRLLQSAELAVAGATPVMSLMTGPRDLLLLPLSAWLIGIAIAGRSTIRPLARLAVRAQLQRDLIVAATEAERARVAADIHDDALQELTLLVHRLDEAGDEEGAGIARTVSDRLRAICGDLRLPILDDLGVGPALDWLVLRIERLSGGEVRLERSDGTRPPADVELAIFRIAQEALGNAVKHGRPPIMVRYHATDGGASLSVDDAGPGILPDAAARAERDGRFGLLNMQQRAEAIGAILDVRRWPTGGTHVALEWRPH
jgi:signal transduction histidine kinase